MWFGDEYLLVRFSAFLSKSASNLRLAAGGIGAFLLSTDDEDTVRDEDGMATVDCEGGRERSAGGYTGGGATRRIENEGMDWADEAADGVGEGLAGRTGFRTGRGGGFGFVKGVGGGLMLLVTLLFRERGFRATYGRLFSGVRVVADVGADLLLNVAIVSETEGVGAVNGPSSGSPESPSDDSEMDWNEEVECA